MTRAHAAHTQGSPWRIRVGAVFAITAMAVAGGMLAEAGRQVQAQDAQATYVRTASPATPSDVSGG
jgi:hypothetical protein